MRIVAANLHLVRLNLVHEFETSSHRKNHLDHVLVELLDADGTSGWGEIASPSDPYFCPDTVETSWLIATRYLLPAVVGREFETPADVSRAFARIRGHHFARAGVDVAAWTLWSAQQGVPLSRALGGTRDEVVAGVSLGIEPTIDDLLEQVAVHAANGYPRVKLKIAPGWDLDPVREVRAAFPEILLHVDANGAYTASEEHVRAIGSLDGRGLTMIEQPFAPRDFVTSGMVQSELDTPICLDESVETLEDLRTAAALGSGRVLNVKVSRMGGLTTAVAAHDLAVEFGWPVWCGGMHEFGVGRFANVALSSLPGFTLPSDVSASDKYYARDVTNPLLAEAGRVRVPTTPGLGATVDRGFVAENSLRTFSLPQE